MTIGKNELIILAIGFVVVVWICAAVDFYKNHQAQDETTSYKNYRMKLYNQACKISEEACNRCAEMAMRTNSPNALSNSVRCLKAVVK